MRSLLLGAVAALAIGNSALANGVDEDRPWQFLTPAEKQIRQNILVLQRQGPDGGGSGSGQTGSGGSGGPTGAGGSSTGINNYFSVSVDNSIRCTASGVGSAITCTGGTGTVTGDQNNADSDATADTNVTGNTVTQSGNSPVTTNNN